MEQACIGISYEINVYYHVQRLYGRYREFQKLEQRGNVPIGHRKAGPRLLATAGEEGTSLRTAALASPVKSVEHGKGGRPGPAHELPE